MLRDIATRRRRLPPPDSLQIAARILAERYVSIPACARRRLRVRHSLILIRLLPDIAADIRAELRRRWERGEDSAARLMLDRVAIYGLLMLLAVAATVHACARAHPCPAVKLRRMIRPLARAA